MFQSCFTNFLKTNLVILTAIAIISVTVNAKGIETKNTKEYFVKKSEKLEIICRDQKYKPTGKMVPTKFCLLTLVAISDAAQALIEVASASCDLQVGDQARLNLVKHNCDSLASNQCDAEGKFKYPDNLSSFEYVSCDRRTSFINPFGPVSVVRRASKK